MWIYDCCERDTRDIVSAKQNKIKTKETHRKNFDKLKLVFCTEL